MSDDEVCAQCLGLQYSPEVRKEYSTVQYSTVQYSTVQYSTVQYSTVQSGGEEGARGQAEAGHRVLPVRSAAAAVAEGGVDKVSSDCCQGSCLGSYDSRNQLMPS